MLNIFMKFALFPFGDKHFKGFAGPGASFT
jgi:hypothetical protein